MTADEQNIKALARAFNEGDTSAGLILRDALIDSELQLEWRGEELYVGNVRLGAAWWIPDCWRWRLLGRGECYGVADTASEAKRQAEDALKKILGGEW